MVFLSILWHMHQPYYANLESGELNSPTIVFRTLFNYYPMALIASRYPSAKINFNITPVLIKQIEGIARGEIKDNFLDILGNQDASPAEIGLFLQELPEFALKRYRIIGLLEEKLRDKSYSDQDILDLKIYMHLISFHPLAMDEELKAILKKGRNFDLSDQECLYRKEKEIFSKTIPLYKKLQDDKQAEISTSPFAHPILPLIFNTDSARKTSTVFPVAEGIFSCPPDAKMQIDEGMEVYKRSFGTVPAGIWPSEGSLSEEILELLSESGISWTATDEYLLARTLDRSLSGEQHNIWNFRDKISLFFRDHAISDLIGFSYQDMEEKEAAADFVKRVENAGKEAEGRIISIILDGENPWDFYPDYGANFLSSLYAILSENSNIKTTTFSQALKENIFREKLEQIYPGSWMGNNFDNWIGKEQANKAWSILKQAREKTWKSFNSLSQDVQKMLQETVMIAESSDWFWWYSLPADIGIKRKFDSYFRSCVKRMYEITGIEIPEFLFHPVENLIEEEVFPYIRPVLDGRNTHFYEWLNAVEIDPSNLWATFRPGNFPVKKLYYGYDDTHIFFRIDTEKKRDFEIHVIFHNSQRKPLIINTGIKEKIPLSFAMDEILEISIPRETSEESGKNMFFSIRIITEDGTQFKIPSHDSFKIIFKEKENWIV